MAIAHRISESELTEADVRHYTDFLVAAPAEIGSGVSVYSVAILPTFSALNFEAKSVPIQQLVIEVQDPNDVATRERIRARIIERLSSNKP